MSDTPISYFPQVGIVDWEVTVEASDKYTQENKAVVDEFIDRFFSEIDVAAELGSFGDTVDSFNDWVDGVVVKLGCPGPGEFLRYAAVIDATCISVMFKVKENG